MKSKTPALLAALGANLIYSLNYVVAKGIMPDYLQPRAIILLRVLGATAIFWLISVFTRKDVIKSKDLALIALASIFGVTINQILFFEGLNLSTPINASIIMVTVPIAVLFFSRIIRKEALSWIKILGIALGTTGAVLLIMNRGRFDFSSGTALGNLLIVVNASSYALYLVLIRPMMLKYHPIAVMKWVFLFGNLTVIPFTFQIALNSDWGSIPSNIWLSISYVIVFTTVMAYFLNNYSLQRISPTTNSAFIYLQPFFTAFVAILLGKDHLSWHMLLPALLIFGGVYLISRTRKAKLSI
ncbi:MAG: drug/metabolite permease [Bacteroidetes bacterium]|nr:MAG: drug/metabolite permease [Bacteroidota bacterium]